METIRGLKFFVVMSFLLTQFSVYGKLTRFGVPFVCVGYISLNIGDAKPMDWSSFLNASTTIFTAKRHLLTS